MFYNNFSLFNKPLYKFIRAFHFMRKTFYDPKSHTILYFDTY